jgi:hypothetical protein
MTEKKLRAAILLFVLVLGITSCAYHQEYRTDKSLCYITNETPSLKDEQHALQQFKTKQGHDYLLGFIEFDDQGLLWERCQMNAVLNKLEDDSTSEDLMIVVFVHGWKHSAKPNDDNIKTFRNLLSGLSDTDALSNKKKKEKPRKVVGIYLGWRGASITVPLLEDLTFWNRKETAHKVGRGEVTEVLSRLDRIRRENDFGPHVKGRTRLIVIGHSFGGAVVNSALAQILENRFVETNAPANSQGAVEGFGDLVVMINPAFEALQFSSLSDMAAERGLYPIRQRPVVMILTSEADWATGMAFPLGRYFPLLSEKTRGKVERTNAAIVGKEEKISESDAYLDTVGHFKPYLTHDLYYQSGHKTNTQSSSTATKETAEEATKANVNMILKAISAWTNDRQGSKIQLGPLTLKRFDNSVGRNPYLNVRVSKDLIPNHNDITNPDLVKFIGQVILISSL